jgi:hypothetical protein
VFKISLGEEKEREDGERKREKMQRGAKPFQISSHQNHHASLSPSTQPTRRGG